MRDGGKGDLRRPLVVSEEQFNNSWDRIFGTAQELKKNIKQVNAEFDKAYEDFVKENKHE